MQKQLFFLAACIALLFAMSSVGQAQSEFMGHQSFAGNEIYGTVVRGEQSQPASMMPVAPPVAYTPVNGGVAPAPPISFSQTQKTVPFVLPAVPVSVAYPVQPMSPPVQHVLPTTSVRQPVCLSGG